MREALRRRCGVFTAFGLFLCWAGILLPAAEPKPVPPPGVIIDTSPDFPSTYVGSPSIAILPDGDYVASHDWFGRVPLNHTTVIFRSSDRGATWTKQAEFPFFWANLFVHRGDLYLLGVLKPMPGTPEAKIGWSHYAIRRSKDGGRTWTDPVDAKSGLLRTDAHYHTAPCPIVIHDGRIWRAMESILPFKEAVETKRNSAWGNRFLALMTSAPVDADLLDAASWTVSEPFYFDHDHWVGNGYLEGNAVLSPEGKIVNVLRVAAEGRDKGVILDVSEDGTKQFSRGKASQIDFPGGAVKFTIRFDPKSKMYWSLATQQKDPMATRNYLVLTCSKDLIHWETRTVLVRHYDWWGHAWQYVDWLFEGENNIVFVSRTAWDGAHNAHDANYMTFHRIEDFRNKSSKDDTPWLGVNTMKRVETKDYFIDGTLSDVGTLKDGEKAFANRNYVWEDVPEQFRDWKFIRLRGGELERIRLTPKNDAVIYMISGHKQKISGWRLMDDTIRYTDANKARCSLYTREIKKDIRTDIHQPGWIGGIVIFKE